MTIYHGQHWPDTYFCKVCEEPNLPIDECSLCKACFECCDCPHHELPQHLLRATFELTKPLHLKVRPYKPRVKYTPHHIITTTHNTST